MVLRSKVEVASRLQCGSYTRLVPASCPGAGTGHPDGAMTPPIRVPVSLTYPWGLMALVRRQPSERWCCP